LLSFPPLFSHPLTLFPVIGPFLPLSILFFLRLVGGNCDLFGISAIHRLCLFLLDPQPVPHCHFFCGDCFRFCLGGSLPPVPIGADFFFQFFFRATMLTPLAHRCCPSISKVLFERSTELSPARFFRSNGLRGLWIHLLDFSFFGTNNAAFVLFMSLSPFSLPRKLCLILSLYPALLPGFTLVPVYLMYV